LIYQFEIFKNFVFYFVRETHSTAPETYAVFYVLRQATTVQSTNILKQCFIIFKFTFILFCIILYNLLGRTLCIK